MYMAFICKLKNVRPHPDPEVNRLAIAEAQGTTVVVGINSKEGDLGILFPCDGQLSKEYATANDLVRRKDPETGENVGGMFDENRRVRAQTLRKVRSEAFWTPVTSLQFAGDISQLTEGMTLNTFNGIPICNKYVNEATRKQAASKEKAAKAIDIFKASVEAFPEHVETYQWKYYKDKIVPGSVVYVTLKIHGTSARVGNVKVSRPKLTRLQTFISKHFPKVFPHFIKLFPIQRETKYQPIVGTRRVVLYNQKEDAGFRFDSADKFKHLLEPEEVVYYELGPWEVIGSKLTMKEVPITKYKDKSLKVKFGNSMRFTYGHETSNNEWVYRITKHGVELPYYQVTKRARELGLDIPPLLKVFLYDGTNMKTISDYIEEQTNGIVEDPLGNHIREGVCIRVEAPDGTITTYKSKSFLFLFGEQEQKDQADYVDLEESS